MHSLSPTTGKSEIPLIKGKKVKNNVTSIKQISLGPKIMKLKRTSDYDSIIQPEGFLSDRYHY